MKATAARTSTSNPPTADVRNLNDLGSLIERADDIVALIARNRAARAGLGRTGRAVLRDHERQLDAELAGIRELASHRRAGGTGEARFQLILAGEDLHDARARARALGDHDLVAVLDRLHRLVDAARHGLGDLCIGDPVFEIHQHFAARAHGPSMIVTLAQSHIEAAEAVMPGCNDPHALVDQAMAEIPQ